MNTAAFQLGRSALRDRAFVAGLAIGMIFTLAIPLAPLSPYGPETISGAPLEPPSLRHPFGTDGSGFDVATRVAYAPRIDLPIAFSATLIALSLGALTGVIAGMLQGRRGVGGWVGEAIMRLMDLFQAFPVFILALAFVAIIGPSVVNLIACIAFLNLAVFARLFRSEVLSTRHAGYIEAAICSGNSQTRIALRHLLPGALPSGLVLFSVNLGFAILLTAGLSFVGAGVRVPTAEWGVMVSDGARDMVIGKWWSVTFPGLAIGICVFGFGLLGDGLRHLAQQRGT